MANPAIKSGRFGRCFLKKMHSAKRTLSFSKRIWNHLLRTQFYFPISDTMRFARRFLTPPRLWKESQSGNQNARVNDWTSSKTKGESTSFEVAPFHFSESIDGRTAQTIGVFVHMPLPRKYMQFPDQGSQRGDTSHLVSYSGDFLGNSLGSFGLVCFRAYFLVSG